MMMMIMTDVLVAGMMFSVVKMTAMMMKDDEVDNSDYGENNDVLGRGGSTRDNCFFNLLVCLFFHADGLNGPSRSIVCAWLWAGNLGNSYLDHALVYPQGTYNASSSSI
ncbi:hypothetical protein PoB_001325700 [Plakobranchus ocellatus]|uniref:Secreted protein n=1 Tax=Plakobranchus ocellatus TaxID=259542 RepID=A0AAV3YX58_9GAST|nr:hypothetical protein PoB_001325700 [Plakobranchus ocellatus]